MKIGIVTLGCDKNTVDAEYIAGWLAAKGAEIARAEPYAKRGDAETRRWEREDAERSTVSTPSTVETRRGERGEGLGTRNSELGTGLGFDAVVILSCGFIDAAQQESSAAIEYWLEQKRKCGGKLIVALAGCLSQLWSDQLRAQYPEIDLIAGVGEFAELAEAIAEKASRLGNRSLSSDPSDASDRSDASDKRAAPLLKKGEPDAHLVLPAPRLALDHCATAYLKVSDGCDYACAFCSIPLMKGRYHSVTPEILIEEARGLIARGAREIILVAQDVSAYGTDLTSDDRAGFSASYRLPSLLRDLAALPGDFWLRIMYFYPGGFSDEMIEVMAGEPKICPYLDIPLQHLDSGIIRAMRRPYSKVKVFDWIERLRARLPDVSLRTTFVVGFPGETDKEFKRLLKGLGEIRFDNAGFFPFSPQEGTPAAKMKGQIPEKVKLQRCERLARRQRQIAEEALSRFIGRQIEVLVDGRFPGTDLYIGHARCQAPEVDGMTRFVSTAPLENGLVVRVTISAVEGFDLIGEAVSESHSQR
ncbi:MAG: 30S ribosomal protein S12 methylthiotransferase RimO [Candidatus Sumerlaeota bacterium]|nr:30S ribosomal protein S12 methylthiotransferase RimO [Candidatus Sumerlaeota bacterium]